MTFFCLFAIKKRQKKFPASPKPTDQPPHPWRGGVKKLLLQGPLFFLLLGWVPVGMPSVDTSCEHTCPLKKSLRTTTPARVDVHSPTIPPLCRPARWFRIQRYGAPCKYTMKQRAATCSQQRTSPASRSSNGSCSMIHLDTTATACTDLDRDAHQHQPYSIS